MTINTQVSLSCDRCKNITWGTWTSETAALSACRYEGWEVRVINHWDLSLRDYCPPCVCKRCRGSEVIPDFSNKNAYGEPEPVRCPACIPETKQ